MTKSGTVARPQERQKCLVVNGEGWSCSFCPGPLLSPFQMCGLGSKFCFPYAAREPNETQSLHYAFFAQHLLATVPGLNFKAFSSAVKVLFICSFS